MLEEEKLCGVPLLIYANKRDLVSSASNEDIIKELMLHEIRGRNWTLQACSAIHGEGVQVRIQDKKDVRIDGNMKGNTCRKW